MHSHRRLASAVKQMKDNSFRIHELHCEIYARKWNSNGLIIGDDPTKYAFPLLLIQSTSVTLCILFFRFLLKPFGQPSFVPQMLGGLVLGPSFLGRNRHIFDKLFPSKSVLFLEMVECVTFVLLIFLISVRMDIGVVKRCGKLSFMIGIASFIFPLLISIGSVRIVKRTFQMDEDLSSSLNAVASLESSTAFPVVISVLTHLKLLNSELGRLAAGSSMISCLCSWVFLQTGQTVTEGLSEGSRHAMKSAFIVAQMFRVLMFLIIIFGLRPVVLRMMKRTPEGKCLKESNIILICLMVFGCSFYGEVTGQHYFIGPIILGIITPDCPPMGSSLTDKIGSFVSGALLPLYLLNVGRKVDLCQVRPSSCAVVGFLALISVLGKLTSVVVVSLHYKIPFIDALALGVILNCQGIFDIQLFNSAREYGFITDECFSIMVITAVLKAAILVPLAGNLYDPSRKYVSYSRYTIQHARPDAELRILACIYQQENVPNVMTIIEASNPTRESPMAVYVMNLEDNEGRFIPLFIAHKLSRAPSTKRPSKTDRILNAFMQYEAQNEGLVSVQCFSVTAPYATMHDDICMMALDKRTSLVIIPYHKTDGPQLRVVNKNVLEKSPCSVGILYDRSLNTDSRSILSGQFKMNVCVLFIGGPDDLEALAYGARMADHPGVKLTVLRFVDYGSSELFEKKHDLFMINQFRMSTIGNERVELSEENVTESADTARVLKSMDKNFDLIVVGRRHDEESPMLVGLSEWSELEELGVIGDILASSDFDSKASVLVLQQQASVVEEMVESPKLLSRPPTSKRGNSLSFKPRFA